MPVLVGIFAIPEIIDLAVRGTSIAGDRPAEEFKPRRTSKASSDTFRHFWLVFRCSDDRRIRRHHARRRRRCRAMDGLRACGAERKGIKERAGFGKGDIRGVLGPSAANNSKEGGELIPTVAFGVPGSGARWRFC